MSFQFLIPVHQSIYTCSDSGIFDTNEYHDKLMRHSGPDYDELIIPLSSYAFNGLSTSDQLEQLEGIRSHHEGSDFTELFKKLNYSDQVKFLSKVLRKLMFEMLILSFKQLDAEQQQQVTDQMELVAAPYRSGLGAVRLLRYPKKIEEDFRLRRFTQLCRDRTGAAHKLIFVWKSEYDEEKTFDDKEHNSDWKSSFSEFFFGFSIIWFQGQWASGQDMLIEQLSTGMAGVVIDNRQQNESEEDFKLRRFTELCTKVTDFPVQEDFINNVLKKLEIWEDCRLILEPQEYDGAAELLSGLSTLGFGLLSAKYQDHKIEEMSNEVGPGVKPKRHLAPKGVHTSTTDPEEAIIRMRRFRELFDQVSVTARIDFFKELRKELLKQKHYSEAVHFFCGLGPEEQAEMIEKLVHKIGDSAELTTEKFSGECEEDLRLRRFKKVCLKHLSTWCHISWPEADKERVGQWTSDHNKEESLYAVFLFDVSFTWFKARCANHRRNPIQFILSGKTEAIEKLPEESEGDFRLRRFAESFKRLQCSSQEQIVDYIQDGLFGDLGYPVLKKGGRTPRLPTPITMGGSFGARESFNSTYTKVILPNLQQRAAATAVRQLDHQLGLDQEE